MGARHPVRRHLAEASLRRRWLLGLYTAALTAFPLVGTLGYENSVALTPPLSVLGVFVGVDAARRAGPRIDRVVGVAARDLLGLAAVALTILLIAQFWRPSCDPGAGLLFLALGPVLSGGLAAVAGIVGVALVPGSRRGLQVLVGGLPLGFCLVLGLLRLYVDPAVYALDPFWGYFAGPIYDEAIAVDRRYLLFRLYNLLGAAAVLAALRLAEPLPGEGEREGERDGESEGAGERESAGERDGRVAGLRRRLVARPFAGIAAAVSLAGALWFGLQPDRHGFHRTAAGLAEALPVTRVTEHFIVRYAPTSATAREIDVVVAELEFAYTRLAGAIGRAPSRRIEVFIFPDPAVKRRLLGAGRTEVAPPWRLQLYLNHQPFPAAVMPHELAHAFESVLGDPVFGVSGRLRGGAALNLALVEGFATAMAPRTYDALDLHDSAAILDHLGLRPGLAGLMGLGFWGQASKRAYTAAGSFCLWLAETRGVPALAALYTSAGDFAAIYGERLPALEAAWLEFLRQRPLDPREVERLRQLFERPSIFQRPCAHRAANLAGEAARAHHRGDLSGTLAAYATLCAIEPERPEHAIAEAGVLAEAGAWSAAEERLLQALGSPGMTAVLSAAASERLGDLAMISGRPEVAADHYRSALVRSPNEAKTRDLQLRLLASEDAELRPYLQAYLLPLEGPALRPTQALRRLYAAARLAALPRAGALGDYLLGLNLLGIAEPASAAAHLARSLDPAHGAASLPSPEFLRSARLHLVNALVRIRAYDRAEAILGLLEGEGGIGNGHRQVYREWRARIAFFRGYLPPAYPPVVVAPARELAGAEDEPEDEPEDELDGDADPAAAAPLGDLG